MLNARFYNNVLRFVAFLCFLVGIGGFLVDLLVRLDYVVVVFATNGALVSAVVWLIVWVGVGALFMVIAYAAEHLEVIYRGTYIPEDTPPTD